MKIYTDSIIVNSPLLLISGQTPQSGDFVPDTMDDQLNIVLEKIDSILIKNNCSKNNIVNMSIYITDRSYLQIVRDKISNYMGNIKPTMTLVVVQSLVNELFKVEIDATA